MFRHTAKGNHEEIYEFCIYIFDLTGGCWFDTRRIHFPANMEADQP